MAQTQVQTRPITMIQALNEAMREEMRRDERVFILGEDIQSGVYGASGGLAAEFGKERVRDCPLSENAFFGAAVGAAVEQHLHAAVAVARHDHRLAPELGGDVVTRIRHLAAVADEQPGAAEDALHLEFENLGIGIDAPVHAAGLDERGDLVRISVAHGNS